jgi:hypothetical protein
VNDKSAPTVPAGSTSTTSEGLSSKAPPELQIIIAAEIQRQLDRERLVLRDAGNLALKIIGGAFALLIAVFTIFGLNTWSGVSQAAKDYMQQKVDALIGRSDSETNVKQTLNNLVNRAIVASALTAVARSPNKQIELSTYEWDRLKSWLKVDSLSLQDFSDSLAVLNAQSNERKTLDANVLLKYMLSPKGGSLHEVVRDRPDKIRAILSDFQNPDMGPSVLEIAQSSDFSQELRIQAINYIRDLDYVDAFDKLMGVESVAEPGILKQTALVTCAMLRPSDKQVLGEVQKLLTPPATVYSLKAASAIVAAWWSLPSSASWRRKLNADTRDNVTATTKRILSFGFDSGMYIDLSSRPDFTKNRGSGYPTYSSTVEIWVPTSKTGADGAASFSINDFASFSPYWDLLADAANSGDLAKITSRMIREGIRIEGQNAIIDVSLSGQSELVVKNSSGEEHNLKGSEISKVKMWAGGTGLLSVEWNDGNASKARGSIVRFLGGGFKFSLEQVSASGQ